MIHSEEKIQLRSWGNIQKRLENTNCISTDFMREMEVVFNNPSSYDSQTFQQFELEEIFHYLKESHTYYLDIYLPKIENTLHQLFSKFGEEYLSLGILLIFIQKYKSELVQHIEHEEKVLFTFVEELLKGEYNEKKKDFVINHFLHTHNDNVVVHLDDLKEDLITFDQSLKDNLAFKVLFYQLDCFQGDLQLHGLIEDTIFIEKVLGRINQFTEV